MEKLTSPFNDEQRAKIDRFFVVNKNYLKFVEDRDINVFIKENGLFLGSIKDLSESEKMLAWMYLRKLLNEEKNISKQSKSPKKFNIKMALGFINLIVILIMTVFVLYKCSTRESRAKNNHAELMTQCQYMIEQNLNHPKTVDHYRFSTRVFVAENGNTVVIAPFSAKNAFGVEMEHQARCVFLSNGKREISIV